MASCLRIPIVEEQTAAEEESGVQQLALGRKEQSGVNNICLCANGIKSI